MRTREVAGSGVGAVTRMLMGVARKALRLALIELLIPGGTLVVLTLLLSGASLPGIPQKVAALLPILKGLRRT